MGEIYESSAGAVPFAAGTGLLELLFAKGLMIVLLASVGKNIDLRDIGGC